MRQSTTPTKHILLSRERKVKKLKLGFNFFLLIHLGKTSFLKLNGREWLLNNSKYIFKIIIKGEPQIGNRHKHRQNAQEKPTRPIVGVKK